MGQQCSDNWYTEVFYQGEKLAVLQPKKMICHDKVESEPSPQFIEFAMMMLMMFYIGCLVLLFIIYRSCSRKRTDGFRLLFIYLLGTICVALALNFGVSAGGFTRLVGWGVLTHNMGEYLIISRIWFGERYLNALPLVFYFTIFIIGITLLPLPVLWFIGMFQGGIVDYLLVYTYIYLLIWTDRQTKTGNLKSRRKYMCAGVWASVIHIISIQPLFFGMALAYSPLAYLTTIFILPTFVLYIYWASAGKQKAKLVFPRQDREDSDDDEEEVRLMVRRYSKPPDDDNEEKESFVQADGGRSESNGKPKIYKDVLLDIIEAGISNLDPSIRTQRNWFLTAAVLTALVNSFLVYFSPCFVDLSFLLNCDPES